MDCGDTRRRRHAGESSKARRPSPRVLLVDVHVTQVCQLCDAVNLVSLREQQFVVVTPNGFGPETSLSTLSSANKNATRSTCPLQLPWGKGCRAMRTGIPSRKGAVDDGGSRRHQETVAHFGHP